MDKSTGDKLKDRIREHGQTYKIDQLCLDEINIQQFTPQLAKIVEKCNHLEYLSLNDCRLQSLLNLPKAPKLSLLQLSNNMIQDKHLQQLSQYPCLNQLSLSNNKIKQVQSLKVFEKCPDLLKLYLEENPICEGEYFRSEIFSILPQIQIVNGFNKNGNKEEEYSSGEDENISDEENDEEESEEEENESPEKIRKK